MNDQAQGLSDKELIDLKRHIHVLLHGLASGGDVADVYHENAHFWGSHPFNEVRGHEAISGIWEQLRRSLPDLERRDSIFVAGNCKPDDRMPAKFAGRPLVATMGHLQGTFEEDLCGIPATRGVVHLRLCEVHHIRDGRIAHSYSMIDMLDLMRQADIWPCAQSLGREEMWAGPSSNGGVRLDDNDQEAGQRNFETVYKMHQALLSFDGVSLDSMQHAQYWSDNFLWYGPAGIGTTRGMLGFQAYHQIPFLIGFPDRTGPGHYVRIGDGDFVVTGGWPSVRATHLGEWLGLPPTGRQIEFRVMDFYHFIDGKIHENWVPIDVLHVMKQMGFDALERLRLMCADPRTISLPG